MDLINKRDLKKHGRRTVYAFNSFFFSSLCYNYQRVQNWTRAAAIDVFSLDKIIFPINQSNAHWFLAVVNVKALRFESFDSLGYSHSDVLHRLQDWLNDESKDKKDVEVSLAAWTHHHPNCPKQNTGHDCGVFTCRFADCCALDMPFDFSQSDITKLRILISLQLLKGDLDCYLLYYSIRDLVLGQKKEKKNRK